MPVTLPIILLSIFSRLLFASNDIRCPWAKISGFAAKPKLQLEYDHVVHGTGVRDQCGGTCWLESGIATVESSTGRPIATEFNILQTMRERLAQALSDLGRVDSSKGYVDLLGRGHTLKDGLNVIARQGVVFREQFSFTPDFIERMEAVRKVLKETGSVENIDKITPLDVLNVSIGLILRSSKAKAKANGGQIPPAELSTIKQQVDALLDHAEAGIKIDKSAAHENFNQLFPKKIDVYQFTNSDKSKNNPLRSLIFKIADGGANLLNRSRFRYHTSPQSTKEFETAIISHLRQGKNVWIAYYKEEQLVDPKTGIVKLDMSITDKRKVVKDHPEKFEAHGVVVEGYKLDTNGNLEW
jgi:hypothetical protein